MATFFKENFWLEMKQIIFIYPFKLTSLYVCCFIYLLHIRPFIRAHAEQDAAIAK